MNKIIALQSARQDLSRLLEQQGYTVIDMYQAHRQREIVDAYLYTAYHPDALTAYHSTAGLVDSVLDSGDEANQYPSALMLNITNFTPEQVVMTLKRRLPAD